MCNEIVYSNSLGLLKEINTNPSGQITVLYEGARD